MSEVKRYDCTNNGFAYCMGCYVMELADDGLYVRAEDYDSLRAQLAAAEAKAQTLSDGYLDASHRAQQAEAERDRAVNDAERYRWLRGLKCNSLRLTLNGEHACNYMTAAEWIEEEPQGWFADDPPEAIEAMKATNTIWTLQIYPDTPIGFIHWDRATLDEAIDAAIASAAGEAGRIVSCGPQQSEK